MFQKGDRVKIIGESQKGSNGTITEQGSGYTSITWWVLVDGFSNPNHYYESSLQLINNKNHMEKFYRVKKDTYLFTAGAILSNKENSTQYKATDDIWHVEGNETLRKFLDGAPAVAADVVENSPDWFERVYKVSSIRGMAYVVKSAMKDLMSKVAVNKDGEVEAGTDVEDKK